MNASPASRTALALIAILCGGMGFVLSTAAVPSQSTALAADALIFLRQSALAWLAMWVTVGAFRTPALLARVLGVVMMLLGAGVLAIAWGRLRVGSTPEPLTAAALGSGAFLAQLVTGVLELRSRGARFSLGGLWRAVRDPLAAHLAVIAAAAVALAAKSNVGDIAVGAAIAAMVVAGGAGMVLSGRLPDPSKPEG